MNKASPKLAVRIGIALLGLAYLAQLPSPLRLNTDVCDFLRMARSADQGDGFYPTQDTKRYPPGYPVLLFVCHRTMSAGGSAFVALNLLFLTVGLASAYSIVRSTEIQSELTPELIVLLTASSFVMVKHVTLALSDVPYFGVSALTLYAARRVELTKDRRRWAWAGVGAILLAASISVRTIGVALLPALVWAAVQKNSFSAVVESMRSRPGRWFFLLLTVAAATAATCLAVGRVYLTQFVDGLTPGRLLALWHERLVELGEIVLNLPVSRFPQLSSLVPLAGAAAAAIWIAGILHNRRRSPTSCGVYLTVYVAILAVWPFTDNRFWLPVLPFVWFGLIEGFQALLAGSRGRTRVLAVLIVLYLVGSGGAALFYSTKLSWAGEQFASQFGPPTTQQAYRIAWGLEPYSDRDSSVVDMADLLRRYDRRARYEATRRKMAEGK